MRWTVRRAALVAEAALFVSLASLAVRLLPPTRTTRLLGRPVTPDLHPASSVPSPRAVIVGRAVEHVAGRLPWRPMCLPQAIATRAMLRRRGIASEGHLGVVETAPFTAHAWVTVGGTPVQGGPAGRGTDVVVLR